MSAIRLRQRTAIGKPVADSFPTPTVSALFADHGSACRSNWQIEATSEFGKIGVGNLGIGRRKARFLEACYAPTELHDESG